MRDSLLSWTRTERDAVYAYLGRQYTLEVERWVELRTTVLRMKWPGEKDIRLWHEAAAELVAWQRNLSTDGVLAWLAEWEATVSEVMKQS